MSVFTFAGLRLALRKKTKQPAKITLSTFTDIPSENAILLKQHERFYVLTTMAGRQTTPRTHPKTTQNHTLHFY